MKVEWYLDRTTSLRSRDSRFLSELRHLPRKLSLTSPKLSATYLPQSLEALNTLFPTVRSIAIIPFFRLLVEVCLRGPRYDKVWLG